MIGVSVERAGGLHLRAQPAASVVRGLRETVIVTVTLPMVRLSACAAASTTTRLHQQSTHRASVITGSGLVVKAGLVWNGDKAAQGVEQARHKRVDCRAGGNVVGVGRCQRAADCLAIQLVQL